MHATVAVAAACRVLRRDRLRGLSDAARGNRWLARARPSLLRSRVRRSTATPARAGVRGAGQPASTPAKPVRVHPDPITGPNAKAKRLSPLADPSCNPTSLRRVTGRHRRHPKQMETAAPSTRTGTAPADEKFRRRCRDPWPAYRRNRRTRVLLEATSSRPTSSHLVCGSGERDRPHPPRRIA